MYFYNLRPFLNWALMIAAIVGVFYVGYYQSHSSNVLRIASGERNSHEFQVGTDLKQAIETFSDFKVELVESGSSSFNRGVIQAERADIAILSPSVADMTNLTVIAPIEQKYMHVIVKVDSPIDQIKELSGNRISLGSMKSDHRKAAYKVLEHYRVDQTTLRNTEVSHLELLEGDQLDGAIILSSINDGYIHQLLASGNFALLDIQAAEGFAEREPFYQYSNFTRGLYPSIVGPLPQDWLSTITTQSWLVSRSDLDSSVVNTLLDVIQTKEFTTQYPLLNKWLAQTGGVLSTLNLHQAAEQRFNPYEAFKAGAYQSLLSIWAYKWIILCVLVLLWNARSRWIGYRETKEMDKLAQRTQRIQALLEDISEHEQLQADVKDYRLLTRRLAEARKIKHEGLLIAKEQKMTDSLIFISFLQQCDHVIKDIQWKLSLGATSSNQAA